MTVMTAPGITEQLAQAQLDSGRLRTELGQALGELAQAVEAKDYERAAGLKARADELRPSALLAEHQVTALQQTVQALREHEARENAEAIEKERRERGEAAWAAATAAENEAVGESRRLFDEAQAALSAVKKSLSAALAAESVAGQHRQAAEQAMVDAGVREPSRFPVTSPNYVRSRVEESQMLGELLRTVQ
ncbi:hypothetical protein [Streptomyces sp. NPDC008139]|uniref:hypothetical protein n=1 Tax=Streptomyces sp. NPDC008139 TaxID=3364814 RepID=UPI0036EFEDB8